MTGFCVSKSMDTKICSKCEEEKEISEFYKDKENIDGLRGPCKKCWLKNCKKWTINNLERDKLNKKIWKERNPSYGRKYYKSNKDQILKKCKEYRINNIEKVKEAHKRYYHKHKKEFLEYARRWAKNNVDKKRESNKKWAKNNLNKRREKKRKWQKEQRKNNIEFRIKGNISIKIWAELKKVLLDKNGKSSWSFLPYTIDDLIKHLESMFEPWMNWQNYGNKRGYWNIDHILPQSSFHFKNEDGTINEEEIRKCWALENLQPMEFITNCRKNNKIL